MPKSEFEPPDLAALTGGAPAAGNEAAAGGDAEVSRVLGQQTDALMKREGVVMVGEGQDEVGRPAIVIGVKQRHQLASLPRSIDGVPVTGWVVGEVDALKR